jgi:Na+/glutamate symporter
MGIALTLAPQIISLPLSSWNGADFNSNLFSFSYTTAVLSIVFGVGTHIQAWNVSEILVREPLYLISFFVTIWASSLFIKMEVHERLVGDIFLLVGTSFGILFWSFVNDIILQVIGLLTLCAITIHFLQVIVALVYSRNDTVVPEVPENSIRN